jgi:putative protease
MRWNVVDSAGRVLVKEKHALSLKDLNLSARLPELIEAGIDSFKIEGRLKEPSYVANVTRHYSSLLDDWIERQGEDVTRASSGAVTPAFEADPERSFNRGFTEYFLSGRERGMVNMDTPKSMGKRVARVVAGEGNRLKVESLEPVHNADGLCYLSGGELRGIRVNSVEGDWLRCHERVSVPPGTWLYRNHDHAFEARVARRESSREIRVSVEARAEDRRLLFVATDEDNVTASVLTGECFEPATRPEQAEQVCRQLQKCGGSGFRCDRASYHGEVLFVPAARVNHYRRQLLEALAENRERARERWVQEPPPPGVPFTGEADWRLNITNSLSEQFYRSRGVALPEPGFEARDDHRGKAVMRSRYCLLFELDACLKQERPPRVKLPLYLYNNLGRFRLEFDCAACFMQVVTL